MNYMFHGKEVIKIVVLVKSDDWQGLYINNKLWEEGHVINFHTIIKSCKDNNVSADDLEEVWVSEDYYENVLSIQGNFPDSYEDLELE